jgi:hypothetical protein
MILIFGVIFFFIYLSRIDRTLKEILQELKQRSLQK